MLVVHSCRVGTSKMPHVSYTQHPLFSILSNVCVAITSYNIFCYFFQLWLFIFAAQMLFVHWQSSSGLETLKYCLSCSHQIDKTHVRCVMLYVHLRFTVSLQSSVSTDNRPVHPSRPTFELCHSLVYAQCTIHLNAIASMTR